MNDPKQIKRSFDEVTIEKIKRSALIASGGFIVSVIPMLVPDILKMLEDKPAVAAFVGVTSTFIVNTIREYLKGVQG